MLTVSSGALVVVPTVVDTEAADGEAGSGVVFKRVGAGLRAVSSTVWGVSVGAWMVGPCADTLGTRGLEGFRLAVERLAVDPGGPGEPAGLLTLAGVAPAGWALVAGVGVAGGVAVTGLDDELLPGARVPGEDGVLQADTGVGGVGALETAPARGPPAVTEVPTSVLCAVPAVTAGEVWSPPRVPLVSVMGDGVAGVILSPVLFRTPVTVSMDEFVSEWSHVRLRTAYR